MMKRQQVIPVLLMVLFGIGIQHASHGQNLMNQDINTAHYLEMARYTVKNDQLDGFQALKEKTFQKLKTLKGFVSVYSYKDVTKENDFIDLVIWESLEDAKQAEASFTSIEEFKPYNASLEKVGFYGHANLVKGGQSTSRAISNASIMEFVAYSLREGSYDKYLEARKKVFQHLSKQYKGFQSVKTWRMAEDPSVVIDIVFWSDLATAQKAFQESSSVPAFAPFNQTIQAIKTYGDFKKVY